MIEALMKAQKCVLHRSNDYMVLYYDIFMNNFNLDENANFNGFEDIEDYHLEWLDKHITLDCQ